MGINFCQEKVRSDKNQNTGSAERADSELILNDKKELKRSDQSRNSILSKNSIEKIKKYEIHTIDTVNVITQPEFTYRKKSLLKVFS